MNSFYILEREGGLDIGSCSQTVDRISKLLSYRGSCIYFPSPDGECRRVLMAIDEGNSRESETEHFLRTLAGEMGLSVLLPDGSSAFLGSDDCDTSFIDRLPAPDDECLPIKLLFRITDIKSDSIARRTVEYMEENGYDAEGEDDGFTVYLGANSYLDVFYKQGDDFVSGEIDCSFSGAGVYAEAVRFAEGVALALRGSLEFFELPGITYTDDFDFESLRLAFYPLILQQLTFAINDDRDGLPAYVGWGTDAFEPEFIPGTVVSPFGRYSIEKLLSDIEAYGFSYVCDRKFLFCNTPSVGADSHIKEALNMVWNSIIGADKEALNVSELFSVSECEAQLEAALDMGTTVPFPKDVYRRLCRLNKHPMKDFSKNPDLVLDFQPGYANGDIRYGFGHYLRRFKLPGRLSRSEFSHSEDILFYGDAESGYKLAVNISYNYHGDGSESPLGHNWVTADESDIEIFDIGSGSLVRFVSGMGGDGMYRAEAEVYILDELYRFAMVSTESYDVEELRESLRSAISVEDWYDEVIREESPDPHAPGATFCSSGITPPCRAFVMPFPPYPELMTRDALDASRFADILSGISGEASCDGGAMIQNLINGIVNKLREDDLEEDASSGGENAAEDGE